MLVYLVERCVRFQHLLVSREQITTIEATSASISYVVYSYLYCVLLPVNTIVYLPTASSHYD